MATLQGGSETQKWSEIRALTRELMYCENTMGDLRIARESLDMAENRLRENKEALEAVKERLMRHEKKRDKAKTDERREKYQAKLTNDEIAINELGAEVERDEMEIAKRKECEKDSEKLRAEINKMLMEFKCEKWVTLMAIEDVSAIRLYNNLSKEGKKLHFKIGSSIREGMTTTILKLMRAMGFLENLESKRIYELTESGFRVLSDDEKARLEEESPKAKASKAKGSKGKGSASHS